MADKKTEGNENVNLNNEVNKTFNNNTENFADLLKVNMSGNLNNTLFGLNQLQAKTKPELPKNEININLNSLQGVDNGKLKDLIIYNYNENQGSVSININN